MSTIQLNFTLRTSSKCKTVHLVGSWDTYKSHLPLSKDSSKSGGWRGTFRFSTPALMPGQRYWYYYIIDGYHVSHDPAREHTVEPTTGRKLNILDIPLPKGSSTSYSSGGGSHHSTFVPSSKSSRNRHYTTASGRGISPSQIKHPHPSRPYETQLFRSAEMEALGRRFATQRIASDSDSSSDSGSASDSDDSYSSSDRRSGRSSLPSLPSLSSRSSHNSSPSSISSVSSTCSCERYARLKDGKLVRIDCGGSVCATSESSSGDERRSRRSKSSKSGSKKSSGSSRKIKFRR